MTYIISPHPTLSLRSIGIYTSVCAFSLEGEGWDEGDINS